MKHIFWISVLFTDLSWAIVRPPSPDYDSAVARFQTTLSEMVKADTTNPPGNEKRVAEIAARRLQTEGIGFEMVDFAPGRSNLVARLQADGTSRQGALLLIAHTDVVTASHQNWSSPPHEVTHQNGYLVGRGVGDDLGMAAMALETMILAKNSGRPLKRDLVLALTGDEESGGTGVKSLLKNRPELIASSIAINEGGGLVLGKDGKVKYVSLQVAEKTYQDIEITAKGPTGHSSVPLKDNAIYRLSKALARLAETEPPVTLQPLIRSFLLERSKIETGELSKAMVAVSRAKRTPPASALAVLEKDPGLSAGLRTTCVATVLSGGTRVNALPSEAKANINCRILPGDSIQNVVIWLTKTFRDPSIEIRPLDEFEASTGSPLDGEGPKKIAEIASLMWPGIPVIPILAKGATDSRYLRQHGIASYGLNPIALSEEDSRRMHGVDERIPVASLRPGMEYLYRLIESFVF